ncbi:xanthine dehydrogenase family protein subunit M [Sulfolobus tengchongensis]|uniref:Xanthine dehydrogenase family protein subunit M n=1 Tax=Sulfolobus tengchongensis TaxID=207809 RepID=A0AAX4L2E2_9CREN
MYPAPFDYFAPTNLKEALELLSKYGDEAKILAGGQSLIIAMKLRIISPKYIIDINNIPNLSYITESEGYLKIGALTRYADLEYSDLIKTKYPLLHESIKHLADPTVRNWGTVGGNVCYNHPGNNLPAVMLAYNAEFVATSLSGSRIIKAKDFFLGPFQTALRQDEILTEVRIPIPQPRNGGHYMKLERRVGDFAIVSTAVNLSLDYDGTVKEVGIAIGGASNNPVKITKAEELLRGNKINDSLIKEVGKIVTDEITPVEEPFGPPADYKKAMAGVLTVRAIRQSLRKILGGA